MIRKSIFSMGTALGLIAATSLHAEAHKMSDMIAVDQLEDGNIYRMVVETSDWGDTDGYATVDAEWEEVGEIADVMINRKGQVVGLLAEIGGFLDIGDRHVILKLDQVRLVGGEGDDPTYHYVTNLTEDQLSKLEEVDQGLFD